MSPTYDYQCLRCKKVTEEFFKIDEKKDSIPCNCGAEARKILSPSSVIGDDMPYWMRHEQVRGCLQGTFEKPITTRGEYNRYLKDKGIAEISSSREI